MIASRAILKFTLALLALFALAGTTHVQPKKGEALANKLFGAHKSASDQKPKVIGYYAKGCLAGGMQLPETGQTWQATSRILFADQPQIAEVIASAGLKPLRWMGDWIGGPMTATSPEIIPVGGLAG